jgi:ABC-type nitrate/sulfonate/bicarbonate transport system ATPase subunit
LARHTGPRTNRTWRFCLLGPSGCGKSTLLIVLVMSAGPSTIKTIFELDLPRPRDLTHSKVAQLFYDIEALLAPDVARSEQNVAAA